jgi:hypothetical protein
LKKSIATGSNTNPSISFDYSKPGVAFSDSIDEVGSFEVEYTVEAPWLDESAKLTREVHILERSQSEV